MTKTFETSEAFTQAVDSTLAPSAAEAQLRSALVAGIDQGETEHRADAPTTDGALNLRIGGWVLRGQDTPVLELIGIVAALATAAVVPGAILAVPLISALSGFSALTWKTWRKGASLTKPEVAVLGFVSVHQPIDEADLLTKMHSTETDGKLDLTDDQISKAIKTLQSVLLRDGSVISLLRKDAADQWRTQLN